MAADPGRQEAAVASALALLAERRQVLVERASLAAHDVLAPEGVPFSTVRSVCEAALDGVAAMLTAPQERSATLELERRLGTAIHDGVPFGALVRALHTALAAVEAQVTPAPDDGPTALAAAGGRLVARLAEAAAGEVDAAQRAVLRRRAALLDRLRAGVRALAATSLAPEDVLAEIGRVAADALRLGWAAVAVPEADGRLALMGVAGRGAAWTQRWALHDGSELVRAAEAAAAPIVVDDPAQIPFEGEDGPAAVLVAPLRDHEARVVALLLGGRDAGPALDPDEVGLAAALADVAGRSLEAARAAEAADRVRDQLVALRNALASATRGDESAALGALAAVGARLARCDLAIVGLVDPSGRRLVARAVHADSAAVAAELAGTAASVDEESVATALAGEEVVIDGGAAPLAARRVATGPVSGLAVPLTIDGRVVGALELLRLNRDPLADADRELARFVAHQVSLVLALGAGPPTTSAAPSLESVVDALVAGGDREATARSLARHAAESAGARGALVFAALGTDDLALAGGHGLRPDELASGPGLALALDALRRGEAVLTGGGGDAVQALAGRGASSVVLAVPLLARNEAAGVLLLLFAERQEAIAAVSSASLAVFAARAGEALVRAQDAASLRHRLARVSNLADAVAPRGSLTAVDLLAAALRGAGASRGAVLARTPDGQLEPLALLGAGLEAAALVSALLEEAGDANAPLVRTDLVADARIGALAVAAETGSATVAPLRHGGELVGALALLHEGLGPAGGGPGPDEVELVTRLAAPLAAVVAAEERGRRALEAERHADACRESAVRASRRVEAFESVADAVLAGRAVEDVLARAATTVTGADAAAVQLAGTPELRPAALHVERAAPSGAVGRVLDRGLRADAAEVRRALAGEIVVLASDAPAGGALEPFLRAGSSAALVPFGPPGAVRGVLVAVSLDPTRPIDLAGAREMARLAALPVSGTGVGYPAGP